MNSATIAVIGLRGKLCTFATSNGKLTAEPISVPGLWSADWLASPEQILAVDLEGVARLWNIANRMAASLLPVDSVQHAAISADGHVLIASGTTGRVCILESKPNAPFDPGFAQFIDVGNLNIHSLALTDDGSRIAISAERQVLVFETANRRQVCVPLPHDSIVTTMRFTPDGKRLVCISYRGRAAAWDIATGTRLGDTLDVSPQPMDLDVDSQGQHCAVAAKDGVTVWDVATGKRSRPGFLGGRIPWFARFLGDSTRIVIAFPTPQRPAEIWNVTTGQPLFSFGYPPRLQCVAVSDDKRQFLTGYIDGMARLWSTESGTPTSPPFEHRSALRVAKINPTGHLVLTITDDLKMSLWSAESAELLGAVSLERLLWQFGLRDLTVTTNPIAPKPLAFFARDSRTAYVLTEHGLLLALSLTADSRSATQLAADVAVRSGAQFDTAGGLRSLPWQELAKSWEISARTARVPSRTAHSIDTDSVASGRSQTGPNQATKTSSSD